MEGKSVILSVLIMSLVMAQIQVEAKKKSCCPTIPARNIYNVCRLTSSQEFCAKLAGCTLVDGPLCPRTFPEDSLQNSDDAVNEYCKLGCASSVCGALTTLQNSDTSEVVNGAVEKCAKACSTFCNKGSMAALETA